MGLCPWRTHHQRPHLFLFAEKIWNSGRRRTRSPFKCRRPGIGWGLLQSVGRKAPRFSIRQQGAPIRAPPHAYQYALGKLAQEYLVPLAIAILNHRHLQFKLQPEHRQHAVTWSEKIDHVVTASNHLSGRYFYNQDNFQLADSRLHGILRGEPVSQSIRNRYGYASIQPHLYCHLFSQRGPVRRARRFPKRPGLQSLQDLGRMCPWAAPESIFPGIRANISGFVEAPFRRSTDPGLNLLRLQSVGGEKCCEPHHQLRRRIRTYRMTR